MTLGAKQLVAFRSRNEVKKLLGIVAADVAKTLGVRPDKIDYVRNLISGLEGRFRGDGRPEAPSRRRRMAATPLP
ncbi:MAG TPA: hypothetical protein VIE64_09845 [Solirubrobacterales bacterium]